MERLVGKYVFLPRYCRRLTGETAPELFLNEGEGLFAQADGLSEARLTQRVLIPRQRGLEDSSRHWSYAMVLEHLRIMGGRTIEIVVELTHGRRPPGVLRTADLKPAGRQSSGEAIRDYRELLARVQRAIGGELGDRDSRTRFEHPWFGPLHAFQWLVFLPFHQRIHIRQAKLILRNGS